MKSTLPESSEYLSTRSECLSIREAWLLDRQVIASLRLSVVVLRVAWSTIVTAATIAATGWTIVRDRGKGKVARLSSR